MPTKYSKQFSQINSAPELKEKFHDAMDEALEALQLDRKTEAEILDDIGKQLAASDKPASQSEAQAVE